MKIAFISDIHGNYHALEAVLEDIHKQRADQIIVLGDIVFKGPLPERCVQTIRNLGVVVLRGNIDELVALNAIQDGFAKSPEHAAALRTEMEWNRSRLTEADIAYLARLPLVHEQAFVTDQGAESRLLRCVHATPQNVMDIMTPVMNEESYDRMFAPLIAGVETGDVFDSGKVSGASLVSHDVHARAIPSIVAYGHIHVPYVRSFGGRLLFNTGSVGLPFDGDPRASYAILETSDFDNGTSGYGNGNGGTDGNKSSHDTANDSTFNDNASVSIRRIRYDVEAAVRAFAGSGHPFAESVIHAIRTGSRPV